MSAELRNNLRGIIRNIQNEMQRLLRLVRSHPELLELPGDGACTHGNGRKRGCRMCQRDYMRDYRAKKKLDDLVSGRNGG